MNVFPIDDTPLESFPFKILYMIKVILLLLLKVMM